MAGETVITVVGNLTADPELRFTPSGAAVANTRSARRCATPAHRGRAGVAARGSTTTRGARPRPRAAAPRRTCAARTGVAPDGAAITIWRIGDRYAQPHDGGEIVGVSDAGYFIGSSPSWGVGGWEPILFPEELQEVPGGNYERMPAHTFPIPAVTIARAGKRPTPCAITKRGLADLVADGAEAKEELQTLWDGLPAKAQGICSPTGWAPASATTTRCTRSSSGPPRVGSTLPTSRKAAPTPPPTSPSTPMTRTSCGGGCARSSTDLRPRARQRRAPGKRAAHVKPAGGGDRHRRTALGDRPVPGGHPARSRGRRCLRPRTGPRHRR